MWRAVCRPNTQSRLLCRRLFYFTYFRFRIVGTCRIIHLFEFYPFRYNRVTNLKAGSTLMRIRDLHPNIKIRLVTDFFITLTQMAIFPFMAIYFSSHLGAALAGILLMANVIVSILAGLLSGYLSDHLGRKKIIVIAEVIQVASLLVMTLANSPLLTSVWLTYIMFLFSNVSSSIIGPVVNAMIVDVSTEKERTFIYGIGYWLGNISIAAGAALGGLLFEEHRFILFGLFLLVSVASLIIMIFFIEESLHIPSSGKSSPKLNFFQNYGKVLQDRRFMLFTLATILVMSLEFQLDKYIAVRLKDEFHASLFNFEITGIRMFSIIMLINTIVIVLLTLQVSKWLSQFDKKKVLTIGIVVYTHSFSILSMSNSFLIIVIMAFLFTLGELIYSPVKQTVLAGIIDDQSRASYMAVDSLSYNVAMLLGSLGLTLGAIVPPNGMAVLYLCLGLAGMLCYRAAIKQTGTTNKQADVSI